MAKKAILIITPYMVNHDSMFGTGQYPKFEEDTFELSDMITSLFLQLKFL